MPYRYLGTGVPVVDRAVYSALTTDHCAAATMDSPRFFSPRAAAVSLAVM
ncbi:MAG: hypothetical protein JO132_20790 [Streptosporangiaceae bacterium]|nr:hypothetical protein [Streptosporangiaceae bacterium]